MEREKGIEWEGQRERENEAKEKAVFVRAGGISAEVIREIMWVYQER